MWRRQFIAGLAVTAVVALAPSAAHADLPSETLVQELMEWTANEMGMETPSRQPSIVMMPTCQLQRLPKRFDTCGSRLFLVVKGFHRRGTVYFDNAWTWRGLRQRGWLVHELVHYIDWYHRRPTSEKIAYSVQRRYLAQ